MKKIMLILFSLCIATTSFAKWSEEERGSFFNLLYDHDRVQQMDMDSRIKLFNMIDCLCSYYQKNYTYTHFMSFYNEQNVSRIQELGAVTQSCQKMIAEGKQTILV